MTTTPRNPMTEQDMAETLMSALDRYGYKTFRTVIIPARGTHPTRLLVVPEDSHDGPVQVQVLTLSGAYKITSRDEWRNLSGAYGFRLEAPAFAEHLGLTDPDHPNYLFPLPGSGPAQ